MRMDMTAKKNPRRSVGLRFGLLWWMICAVAFFPDCGIWEESSCLDVAVMSLHVAVGRYLCISNSAVMPAVYSVGCPIGI